MLLRTVQLSLIVMTLASSVLSGAEAESFEAKRQRLAGMSAVEKDELRRKQERFDRLPASEQDGLRQFHAQLGADPQEGRLRQIMSRYNEWLKSLPSGQRAELLGLPPDQRIVEIKKLLDEQEKQRFQDLVATKLQPQDHDAIFNWMNDMLGRREEEILSALSPEERESLQRIEDPRRRRLMMSWYYRRRAGKEGRTLIEMLDPGKEDVDRLARELSPEARKLVEKARSQDERILVVRNWISAATFSRMAPRVNEDELQRFAENLEPADKEYLENLPRDRMREELRKLYFKHRFQRFGEPFPPGFHKRPPSRPPGEIRFPEAPSKERGDRQGSGSKTG